MYSLIWSLPLTWVLCSQGAMSQTSSVPPPMVTSIENDPHFMGWYIGPAGTQPLSDPAFWTTSGQYAQGCSASSCSWATACNVNTITYNDHSTLDCLGAHCYTMTIFQTSPYGMPAATNIFCANYWDANTIYRELPASTATTTSMSTSPATPSPALNPGGQTSTTSTSSPITPPSPSAAGATSPSTSSSSSSQAWIAGAVIGPVAGIAILAGLIWFCLRRKKQQPSELEQSPPMTEPTLGGEVQGGVRSLKGNHELDTDNRRVYELEAEQN